MISISQSWLSLLEGEFRKKYMEELQKFLQEEHATGKEIYPPSEEIFQALCWTTFEGVKVVIMGQDPYHGKGQAHGLSFSVPPGVEIPPSLRNIFQELQADVGVAPPTSGSLLGWAKQGVLLLNATLTVRAKEPMSHHGKGWELFTDAIVELLAKRKDPLVFLLWGKSAMQKCAFLEKIAHPHCVLVAPHPSPFSAHLGFLGCRHFSKANQFLREKGKDPIDWGKTVA